MSNMNSMPDLAMLSIFDQLSIRQLAPLRRVSTHWLTIANSAFCRRQSLFLYFGADSKTIALQCRQPASIFQDVTLSSLKHNLLRHDTLNQEVVDTLVSSFPNIRALSIAGNLYDAESVENLIELIAKWKNQLVSVRLSFNINTSDQEQLYLLLRPIRQLFFELNFLPQLQSLHFEMPSKALFDNDTRLYMPILGQLKEFHFYTQDSLSSLEQTITQFGGSNLDLKIGLKISYSSITSTSEAVATFSSKELAKRFTQMTVVSIFEQSDLIPFCAHFCHLEKLILPFDQLTLFELSNSLGYLTRLHTLKLIATSQPQEFSIDDYRPQSDFPQLSSITHLTVVANPEMDLDLYSIHLGHIFPLLTSVLIVGLNYCAYCTDISTGVQDEPHIECVELITEAFKQCPKLSCIRSEIHEMGNIEEVVVWTRD